MKIGRLGKMLILSVLIIFTIIKRYKLMNSNLFNTV
jgi:hypothetical protein